MKRSALLVVFLVTLAVWAPLVTYDWAATWDDGVFILGNPHIRTWEWSWMATTQWYGHWMPLTWLTMTANYALVGFRPGPWHAVNVVLHLVSTVLLYGIARRLLGSRWGAAFVALVWAIHPLRMESVAWISERKDVVMGVCFLGSLLLWITGRRRWAFVAFVLACASKSPAVMLPIWLLAYEWWRAERPWAAVARSLAPFMAVSAVVSAMAFWSLHAILVSIPWDIVGLGPRLLHVAHSHVFYVLQTVWPARLSALIEYTWVPSWDQPEYPMAVALCLLGVVAMVLTHRRWPAVTACAVAYTVAVLPQSGLFQNGAQLVANRYSYLASIPLALLLGAAAVSASRRFPRLVPGAAVGVLVALTVVTSAALPMWRNGDEVWWYAAEHEPTCTQCQDMASAADVRHGWIERALLRQRQAILVSATTMAPRWERQWNVAALLLLLGRQDEAIVALRTYLEGGPDYQRREAENLDHLTRARTALTQLELERRQGRVE